MLNKGVVIRKISIDNGRRVQVNKKGLRKQMINLRKKIKKNDPSSYIEQSVEKDHKGYHVHLLVHYKDEKNLFNQLLRYIGGDSWKKKKEGLNTITHCDGKYGEVDVHYVWGEQGFRGYINKENPSETIW